MAGIYVHIPFCKVKCHYCDFHFSIQQHNLNLLVEAIEIELVSRKDYLDNESVKTIYFGGGTPSILEPKLIEGLLNRIYQNYFVEQDCEITLECNPDDLSEEKLFSLKSLGVNRLSIGVQSFDDQVLKFMNRAHSKQQAIQSIERAVACGISNITIDLIYGVPNTTIKSWEKELYQMINLGVPHLSAYCLTIEPNTVFGNWYKTGKLEPLSDQMSLDQFQYLMEFMSLNGYEQYEISNFAKPGKISRHNSAYWKGDKYLGVGPSAHSYNQIERGWNIANNPRYIKNIHNAAAIYTAEKLSTQDRFNEYVLTRLRTKWGLVQHEMEEISAKDAEKAVKILSGYIQSGEVLLKDDLFLLTNKGKYIADGISADLFAD